MLRIYVRESRLRHAIRPRSRGAHEKQTHIRVNTQQNHLIGSNSSHHPKTLSISSITKLKPTFNNTQSLPTRQLLQATHGGIVLVSKGMVQKGGEVVRNRTLQPCNFSLLREPHSECAFHRAGSVYVSWGRAGRRGRGITSMPAD